MVKDNRATLTSIAALTLALAACQDPAAPNQPNAVTVSPSFSQVSDVRRTIPDQYIVVFDGSVDDVSGRAKSLLTAHRGNLRAAYSSALKGFSAKMSAAAAAAIARTPGVAYVEQDQEIGLAGTQTGATWGLDRIDQPTLPMNGTYTYPNTGAGVNVYIIDSGIRRSHVEFGGRASSDYSPLAWHARRRTHWRCDIRRGQGRLAPLRPCVRLQRGRCRLRRRHVCELGGVECGPTGSAQSQHLGGIFDRSELGGSGRGQRRARYGRCRRKQRWCGRLQLLARKRHQRDHGSVDQRDRRPGRAFQRRPLRRPLCTWIEHLRPCEHE